MEAVDALLAGGQPFSAIVAGNDEMAIGAMKRLAERGVAVPEAVSVIGFDDIPLAPYTVPSLSSMKMPVTEMIQETINRLLSMLDGGELSKRPSFPACLIERESVAAGPYWVGN